MDTTDDAKVRGTQVCLPPQLIAEVDKQAEQEGMYRGRSVIVRRALREYLDKRQAATPRQEAA